jgi:hypothetical protein
MECLTCKPVDSFEDQIDNAYETIRKIHGSPEVSLDDYLEEVNDAINNERGSDLWVLLNQFAIADDGARMIR